nr:type VI secretion system tip protein VgrG [uncultured Duganella sp.]
MPPLQANRDISVTSALADDTLLFRSMSGSEQLGRLSEYRVQLISLTSDIAIGDVLGKPMAVHVELGDGAQRHFHGVVTCFRTNGWSGDAASYEAVVHPWLWLLTRASNCRIFQELSVPDIVAQVCGDGAYGGLVAISNALDGTYAPLAYCVQYRETDFNFVCRLLEQAGIYFYFSHEADKHTMVLADSPGAHLPIDCGPLKYTDTKPMLLDDDHVVFDWSASGQIEPGRFSLNDFDFEKAAGSVGGGLLVKSSIAPAFGPSGLEMFDYPGGYAQADHGTALARARMEQRHGQCERIDATSTARALHTGGLFTLAEHPRDDQNRSYLVTDAAYTLKGVDYRGGGAGAMEFQVTLGAIGSALAFRPVAVAPKPCVQGPQTAIVVGKAGEEIWTDKYGRVKVQFHWDRLGKSDEKSSCWVRVAQGWAGKGWGALTLPRVGMEVVVSFLEGDPDRPLVTGCVYNSDAMPPYPLPAEQTKSTFKSNSSKGGEGYNEFRFEDKKGAEEVYVQAERDFKRVVKNNDVLKVGFETADKGDQDIAIKNDRLLDVGNDHKAKVGNNETITIGKDQTVSIGKDQTVDITGHQKVTASQTIVIDATTSIELKVGGSSIKIEPAKITIKSAQIAITADAQIEAKAGAMVEISGAIVKIN